jgi:hypothetical protein
VLAAFLSTRVHLAKVVPLPKQIAVLPGLGACRRSHTKSVNHVMVVMRSPTIISDWSLLAGAAGRNQP